MKTYCACFVSKSLSLTTAQLDRDNSSVGHFAALIVYKNRIKRIRSPLSMPPVTVERTCSLLLIQGRILVTKNVHAKLNLVLHRQTKCNEKQNEIPVDLDLDLSKNKPSRIY